MSDIQMPSPFWPVGSLVFGLLFVVPLGGLSSLTPLIRSDDPYRMRMINVNPGIFIVIAAYNESRTIRSVADKLLTRYTNVVVVDDGSI